MIEFRPKVKNKYNKLTSEYIKNSKDSTEKNKLTGSVKIIEVNMGKDNESEVILNLKSSKTGSMKSKIVSARNRNYYNMIRRIESND